MMEDKEGENEAALIKDGNVRALGWAWRESMPVKRRRLV